MQDVIDSSQVFIHQVQTYIINKVTQTYSQKPETGNHLTNRSAGARNVEQEQQHPLNIQQAVNKEWVKEEVLQGHRWEQWDKWTGNHRTQVSWWN